MREGIRSRPRNASVKLPWARARARAAWNVMQVRLKTNSRARSFAQQAPRSLRYVSGNMILTRWMKSPYSVNGKHFARCTPRETGLNCPSRCKYLRCVMLLHQYRIIVLPPLECSEIVSHTTVKQFKYVNCVLGKSCSYWWEITFFEEMKKV